MCVRARASYLVLIRVCQSYHPCVYTSLISCRALDTLLPLGPETGFGNLLQPTYTCWPPYSPSDDSGLNTPYFSLSQNRRITHLLWCREKASNGKEWIALSVSRLKLRGTNVSFVFASTFQTLRSNVLWPLKQFQNRVTCQGSETIRISPDRCTRS